MSDRSTPRTPLDNAQVGSRLAEIADLLDIQGADAFRVRAYRQAARTMAHWRGNPMQLVRGDATLPGIGADLAARIAEIAATGTCALLQELHHDLPSQLAELLRLPGPGPVNATELTAPGCIRDAPLGAARRSGYSPEQGLQRRGAPEDTPARRVGTQNGRTRRCEALMGEPPHLRLRA